MKLRYAPEAVTDLQNIKRYIAATLRNPSAASRVTKRILDQCATLKKFPRAGASLAAMTGHETDLRMLACEDHIALYRIDAEMVSVARIINARQDYMRVLFKEADLEQTERNQPGHQE